MTARRPETLPAALVALVVIAASVLAALHIDLPAFLPYIGTAAAGAAFGITQATPAAPVVFAPASEGTSPAELVPIDSAP